MSPSDITVIMTSVTAVAAIVAPVITAIYSAKSQERMKRAELYSPRVYDALAEMSKAYSQLSRGDDITDDAESATKARKKATIAYYEFVGAAYKVMSLIPKESIQAQISQLLTELEQYSYFPSERHDELFRHLMRDITKFLQRSRKKPI